MLTAAEVRQLAGPTAEEYLKEIEGYIIKAAQQKSRSVIIRAAPYAGWLYNERNMSDSERAAIKKLREAGYTVCSTPLLVDDIGLEISW